MFYDIFKELCERRGISCNRAALEMGLSNATPTAWKKRGLTPKADTLAVIANYFDVSTDYLLGEQEKNAPGEEVITEDEHVLLEMFRQIPEEQQRLILDMAKTFAKTLKK